MMFCRHVVNREAVKLFQEDSERPSRLLAVAMQEPRVGFANDQIGCAPARLGKAKESFGLRVPLVVAVQERNEDSRV
jgi:hypothetical protein